MPTDGVTAMPPVSSQRAEFIQIILASSVFQQSLLAISDIAQQVSAHALPEVTPDPHSFQFGQQWKFSTPDDNRFIKATVADIKEHLALASDLELPEFTDYRFMGLAASTVAAIRFTASMGAEINPWRMDTLETIRRISDDLLPLTRLLMCKFAPSHVLCHHKPTTHVALIELITTALGLKDSGLAFDLCVGMPAVGIIPSTGNWRDIEPEGREIFSKEENIEWNKYLFDDISSKPPSAAESDTPPTLTIHYRRNRQRNRN